MQDYMYKTWFSMFWLGLSRICFVWKSMLLPLNRFHVICDRGVLLLTCNPVNAMIRKKLKQDALRSIDWG